MIIQLVATDTDLSAGAVLSYFIADGDGVLPLGITMSDTGKLQGTTEPLLSLDRRSQVAGTIVHAYAGVPMDYAVLSSNGYGSFYYDTVGLWLQRSNCKSKKIK